ncbi:glycine C-acetyltransferase [Oleiharenicola lentus]|jgi:glycine C-acetyltransferase|uniref:2-amino-3-ketobutyrate coenzyme A ligase n=1 Tax=Oleiharenicola lentus TaxID=2508720 RepID=A0A4Q1CBP6_9BACT|nr:glycine C-acetyltransferase [Oleiharenicola lentus]RXK56448.1 glycine C-acetyltransferase [Oleiharenicola lentus]
MNLSFTAHLQKTLAEIDAAGLTKRERIITTHQTAHIAVAGSPTTGSGSAERRVLNLCANNYLGLADHPELIAAAHAALDRWGYGLASVRFICGTQQIHRDLETALARFLGTDDTILYSSCFDANGGLFETLLGAEDAVISDELNHASIIDGIRLCKAQRYRYRNNNLADLEAKLQEADAAKARFKLIATDGVFSMDGTIADLRGICDLADKYQAILMVDDSHAAGFMGATGRGTHEHCGVMGRVDVFTGTLGKALGGASGGYTSGRKEIIDLLRQRSRPYLFSNTIPPAVAGAALKCLEMLSASTALRDKLHANTRFYREGLTKAGLTIKPGTHPIVPIMLGDAVLAQKVSARLLEKGLYAVGFFFPVVAQGQARIRTQVSAAHSREDLAFAIEKFAEVKQEFGF